MLRVVLVHPGDYILPEMGEPLGRYAEKVLRKRRIEIHTKTRIKAVMPREVELSGGSKITTLCLIWTAGSAPNPVLDLIDCPKDRGRIKVTENLEVEGYPGVWAVGDCALVSDMRTGKYYPPTAQHASREGKTLARNIVARERGELLKPFSFKTLGSLAAIGHRTGVAEILGVRFSGFVAWALWRGIYLSKLPRIEKKERVALDWMLDVFFSKDFVQYLGRCAPAVSSTEDMGSSQTPTRPPGKHEPASPQTGGSIERSHEGPKAAAQPAEIECEA